LKRFGALFAIFCNDNHTVLVAVLIVHSVL
jgi:hypothetical protein